MDIFSYRESLTEHVVSGGPQEDAIATYAPTLTQPVAEKAEELIQKYNITTVYDLGAGDLTLAVYLAENTSVTIVAYELNEKLIDNSIDFWNEVGVWDAEQIDVRAADFRSELHEIEQNSQSLLVNCGQSNHLEPQQTTLPLLSSKTGSEILVYNLPEQKQ
jgi:hypothetical protein